MSLGSINCGFCLKKGTVTKSTSNNYLTTYCSKCRKTCNFPLLKISKKIIYLDQNFISNAYKMKSDLFLKRANRIQELSKKQLIICPYSDAHDKETYLFHEREQLAEYIRQLSRNKRFYPQSKIEEQQVINGYYSYLNNEPSKTNLTLSHAIDSKVHYWDDSLSTSLIYSICDFMQPNGFKTSKMQFVNSMIENALPLWRKSQTSFESDFKLEVKDHAKYLLLGYLNAAKSSDIQTILESEDYRIIKTLLDIDREKDINCIIDFLESQYFESIPYVNTSAGLWTHLKKEIKQKQYLTDQTKGDNLIRQLRGIPTDIDHLSVFAPYCDAVFTERRMARYLREWHENPLCKYKFRVFSIDNWTEFDNYLDEIEESMSKNMKEELEFVFGD
jgi:hypothetical protein